MSTLDLTRIENQIAQHYSVLVQQHRGELSLTLRRDDLLPALRYIKEDKDLAFNYLIDVTGVDTRPLNGAFEMVYHLLSQKNHQRLRFKVLLDPADLNIDSTTAIWPGSAFQEREIWDLLGIRFRGLADHSRLYLPDDFEGHPLRKDYSPWAQDTDIGGFKG